MPASAGMTLSMFIYKFSHSLLRRNDGSGINQSFSRYCIRKTAKFAKKINILNISAMPR